MMIENLLKVLLESEAFIFWPANKGMAISSWVFRIPYRLKN